MSLLHRLLDREGDGTPEAVHSSPDELDRDLRLARRLRVNIALAGFELSHDDLAKSNQYVTSMVSKLREFDAVMVDRTNRLLYVWLFDANRESSSQVFARLEASVADDLSAVLNHRMIGCAEFPVDGLTFDALMQSVITSAALPSADYHQHAEHAEGEPLEEVAGSSSAASYGMTDS